MARLGWCATAGSLVMYLSYIDQIARNLAGDKGSAVQPLATMVATALWLGYGLFGRRRDWPLVVANTPGVVLGFVAFATAL